jgi:hypothetical protein
MRKSKMVQQKFSRIWGRLGMKNLEFLDYRFGIFFNRNLLLIVGHGISKFGYFWSKITLRTDSKTESCSKPHCAENCPEFTVQKTAQNSLCPGPYGVRMCPENNPRDLLLAHFDLSIKLFDRYT